MTKILAFILFVALVASTCGFLTISSRHIHSTCRCNDAARVSAKIQLTMAANNNNNNYQRTLGARAFASAICSSLLLFSTIDLANADTQYKLPPIDRKDTNRCNLVSSSIGQANAARDKLYDLRECDFHGKSGAGKDLSGAIASEADFSGVDFKEAQLSKAYARKSKFIGADFTNAILDRVSFDGSDMTGAILKNAVLSGTTFTDAVLKDTDFTDSYLGPFDLKNLCLNPSLDGTNPVTKAETRQSAGCL